MSRNPWACDCSFTPHFQQFITEHEQFIFDSNNITCAYKEDNELSGYPIKYLTLKDLCSPEENPLHWLDILNISMAVIILLIIAKLGYDYFYYKNYGRVPWIVTKMP